MAVPMVDQRINRLYLNEVHFDEYEEDGSLA
jgi:hypothetical protein